MKLEHIGYNKHRLKDSFNWEEKIFSEEWEKFQSPRSPHNDKCALNDIFSIFDSNGRQQPGYVSQNQATAVATIIQWLGSPVGSGWLRDVLDKIEKERLARGERDEKIS